jgi:hypothetical protein
VDDGCAEGAGAFGEHGTGRESGEVGHALAI